ncbi:hypothetical protein VCHA43P277_80183 [Vibrio chagasii]|nr:hypothetical protein VCHA34P126_260036 [Vibrio chagasii]CAH7127165.1 hypothetical protein VCHA50P420_100037 [Vibrio chagasii]CAH7196659.1 hypothetical protein VCHA41O247_240010 [Vibrio chagasii]CAH7384240.1 hypothetical protein VCHA43P277_80183 [Vibrio chagasii]
MLAYLALVEMLRQVVLLDKRGYILPTNNMILERLNMIAEEWFKLSENFGAKFRCTISITK